MTEKQRSSLARLAASGMETGDRRTLALARALAGGDAASAARAAMRRKEPGWLARAAQALEGEPGWEQARQALLEEARMFPRNAFTSEELGAVWG